MAECSYARCVQQRRNIRRELQRWTKNMVHIVGWAIVSILHLEVNINKFTPLHGSSFIPLPKFIQYKRAVVNVQNNDQHCFAWAVVSALFPTNVMSTEVNSYPHYSTVINTTGLERIAEELMGRRKWKLYQESMSRSYLQPLNNNIKRTNPSEDDLDLDYHHKDKQLRVNPTSDSDLEKKEFKVKPETNGDDEGKEDKEEYQKENEKEVERLKDWTPQNKCYFCVDGKLDSEHTNHGVLSPRQSDSDTSDSHSDSEVPTSLTPTSRGLLNNNHHHRPIIHSSLTPPTPGMTTIENVSMAALAVAALSGGGSASPGAGIPPTPHLPFYNPAAATMLTHNWYLANVARTFQNAAAAAVVQQDVDKNGGVSGEQPLDLSKGGSNSTNGGEHKVPMGNNVRLPTLDTKHIFNSDFRAKPRMSSVAGRRTYTEDELQAALRDIQSGKLGTRRAAVIYGIPRSTLRNKVYKLAMERQRESDLNSSTPLKLEEEEVMDDEKELSGAEEEKEVEKALQAPPITMADLFRLIGREQAPEALRTLLQRTKEGQDIWAGMDHSEVGSYIQNLVLASQNILANQKPPDGMVNHLLPELIKEDLLKLQNNNGETDKLSRPSPSNSVITKVERPKSESDMETEDSSSNVILKIPSFKPTSSKNGCDVFRGSIEPSGSLISPPITTDSSNSPPILPQKGGLIIKDVKDVIAQSISQKFQQTLEPPRTRPVLDDFNRGGFTPPLVTGVSVIKTQQDLNRQFQPQHQQPHQQQSQQQMGGKQQGTGGKGTRPKRGKYRNYDRDSLVEAVRAVQRGEMSVHRAGSYYGVPHSTLEYKVKERHLMRPRKRDPKPNPVDEKIASLKQNDLRNSQDKLKPMMKPPQKFPPTSPNGMKLPIFEPGMPPLPGYNPPPPFPFWHPGFPHIPIDYARNPTLPFPSAELVASQMMQKLQEESSRPLVASSTPPAATPTLAKSARQMAESLLEGPGANGSFLDGIIRSSLESGVPPGSEQKSPAEEEERSVANLSNKALLDQLCRNSRLTPLSARVEGSSSSGDEGGRRGSGSPLNFTTGGAPQDENNDDDSSSRYEKDNSSELPTIELSNDSNASSIEKKPGTGDETPPAEQQRKPRIYLKQDLVKPENLKPEMLVRLREVLPTDLDYNGMSESAPSSASENDTAHD